MIDVNSSWWEMHTFPKGIRAGLITPLAGWPAGRPGDPHYTSFFKPNYSWPVIHPVVSDQGHYTFLYRYAKHNREGGRKNKRTNTVLGQLLAQVGVSLCDTFVLLSVHLQAIVGVYFARNFYKATNNVDIFSRWLTRPLCVNRS